jgi:uncharacterized protein (TIGR03382 family)
MWAVGAALTLASAAFGGITGNPLTITATSGAGTASFALDILDGSWSNNNTTWTYNGPTGQTVSMVDGTNGQTIADLEMGSFAIQFVFDPQINLNFGVVAGAANTTFSISSALLSFPTIAGATAQASAGVTASDRNGGGVTWTGLHAGALGYKADYNGASNYATGVAVVSTVAPFGNATGSASFPVTNIGSVSDMSANWNFTLSARDAAQGTSTYIIVPSPAGALAFGVLGLAGAARRRR